MRSTRDLVRHCTQTTFCRMHIICIYIILNFVSNLYRSAAIILLYFTVFVLRNTAVNFSKSNILIRKLYVFERLHPRLINNYSKKIPIIII